MRLDDVFDPWGIEHVERLDSSAFAQVSLEEIWLAAIAMVGQDNILPAIQKAPRRVEPDEAHPTDEECWSMHGRLCCTRTAQMEDRMRETNTSSSDGLISRTLVTAIPFARSAAASASAEK